MNPAPGFSPSPGMAPQDERNSCDLFEFPVFLFWGTNQLRNRPPQIRFVLSTTNRFGGTGGRFPGNSCSSGRSRGLGAASGGRRRSGYAWGKCRAVAAQAPGADGRVAVGDAMQGGLSVGGSRLMAGMTGGGRARGTRHGLVEARLSFDGIRTAPAGPSLDARAGRDTIASSHTRRPRGVLP